MNDSAKIDLENGIFARAARLGVCVGARTGKLFCAEPDARLQAMLHAYNAFFAAENRAFCGQEEREEWENYWAEYRRNIKTAGNIPGVVYTPDLVMETGWQERLNRAEQTE